MQRKQGLVSVAETLADLSGWYCQLKVQRSNLYRMGTV